MSGADIAAEARRVATEAAPLRERLAKLVRLAAEARKLPDPTERRSTELAIFEAAQPLLEQAERPVRQPPDPPAFDALEREARAAAARRARREALLPTASEVPVEGPRWCSRVLDTGEEILGVHRDTGSTYELSLFRDLDQEGSAAVVARRIAAAGGTRGDVERALEALGLEDRIRQRVVAALGGVG